MKKPVYLVYLILVIASFGCKSSTGPQSQTYTSAPTVVGAGTATTWITMNGSGNISSVGVTLTNSALTSLGNSDSMYELAMPSGVSTQFKSIALDYATHDAWPYNHPHIDPHFFLYNMAQRMGIMDGKDTMPPMMMTMPPGYATDSMSEMMMGVHWIDMSGPEYQPGHPFTSTFVYGFTMGSMDFMELMCDKASLDGQKNISGAVKRPTMMSGMSGMPMPLFPATYKITYDASAKTTTIELDGFDM